MKRVKDDDDALARYVSMDSVSVEGIFVNDDSLHWSE